MNRIQLKRDDKASHSVVVAGGVATDHVVVECEDGERLVLLRERELELDPGTWRAQLDEHMNQRGWGAPEAPMPAALRDRWLAALRSGKYRQGRDRLRAFGGHCCFGVLCDVSGIGEWAKSDAPGVEVYVTPRGDGSYIGPPEALRVHFSRGQVDRLMEMNDNDDDDFDTIADWIEAHVEASPRTRSSSNGRPSRVGHQNSASPRGRG